MSETEKVAPLIPGDVNLVAPLFLASQSQIYGFIRALVSNQADAEDLLQETGLIILRKGGEFQPGSNFLAWACQIARFLVDNYTKRQARTPLRFDEKFVDLLANYQLARIEIAPRQSALILCLQQLADRDRELIEACYRAGVKIKSVAATAGKPTAVIYRRLHRIRETLRQCVQRSIAQEEHA